jgi:5-methylthioadenosine/S-adenosylhomocysteine deaminase
MSNRIKIRGATIVSMDAGIGTMATGDILIDRGRIEAVAPKIDDWAVTNIDGRGMIAMPGFVNAHLHLWQPALRGVAANWTLDHYFHVLIGHVVELYRPQDVYIGNLMGALDQIAGGVTTLLDWCHIVNTPAHADAAVDALLESGIRAVFAYGTPMTLFGTREPHPIDARRMRERRLASDDARVTMALAIRGTDFAPGTAEADIRFARDLDLIASFHVACAKHGPRPQHLTDLARQRLLGPDVNVVHANFLIPDEFKAIADTGASITITPEAEMQMGLGIPPSGPARAANASFNLGSDVVTGMSSDMFTQMRFLLQTDRALKNDIAHKREKMPESLDMSVYDVLELATIKGAAAFGLDHRIGSIRPGKQADIVLLRKTDINMLAAPDPVAAIVLHAGTHNVDTVIVGGDILKREGRLAYRDLARKSADLEASSARLYGLLGDKLAS